MFSKWFKSPSAPNVAAVLRGADARQIGGCVIKYSAYSNAVRPPRKIESYCLETYAYLWPRIYVGFSGIVRSKNSSVAVGAFT